jgi:hypothetical protein
MKLQHKLLMAALSLTMSALPSQAIAQRIPISSVPFHITGPGTYELVGNLTCSTPNVAAITIGNITGPVILDFKGFTLTGLGQALYPSLVQNGPGIVIDGGYNSPGNANPNSVIVRNGTITQFTGEIQASYLGNLSIRNMKLYGIPPNDGAGSDIAIALTFVTNALVSDSTLIDEIGIIDTASNGGNRYENLLISAHTPLQVNSFEVNDMTIEHCEFAPPID